MPWAAANGLLMPPLLPAIWGGTTTASVIDATGEKVAWVGRVWNKDHTSKDISRVQFLFSGGVVKAGGSALTVSLQDVNLAAGPPFQPDETQDQTVAIANADASFVSSTWYRTGTFSANRTVAFGEALAVVVEFDGGGRKGADTVSFSNRDTFSSRFAGLGVGVVAKAAGSWTAVGSIIPNILLEFSDGSFGTLDGAVPNISSATITTNSGGTPDERASAFTVPFPCKVDGLWCAISPAAGADFDLVLYQGTTQLAAASVDSNAIEASASSKFISVPIAEQALRPGVTYYVAIKPTTANNVTNYTLDVNAAGHFDAWGKGQNFLYTDRTDAGSWSATTTTKHLRIGIRISAIHDGGGLAGLHPIEQGITG